jgi:hypothetical protein
MSPKEVAGLQGLAMAQGGSLTINPDTGLPEAFNLGNFITSLIPTAVGAMVGGPMGASWGLQAGSGWATAAPILAGAATGAAIAGVKGEDPLMGGFMGGVGGYGGAGIGKAFGEASALKAAANPTTAGFSSTPGVQLNANNLVAPNLDKGISTALNESVNNLSSTMTNPIGTGTGGAGVQIGTASGAPGVNIPQGALPNLGSSEPSLMNTFVDNVGMPKLAMTGAGALLGGLEPSDLYGKPLKSEEDKYDPYATLNLSGDTGLRLYATGGDVYANQSSIASGGLQSLYGTSDSSGSRQPLSQDGYGIGRLGTLTAEGSRAKAADTFYAGGGAIAFDKGGYLNGDGDGMSDSIPATIEGKQPARLADGEFVVPADVVSHLGNGSSKAGSKRLYKMLDKVRHARTGTKKQGREINPNKYLPV